MGPIGVQEMILIVVLALLLFGPKKLPELARMLGKGLTEFRRAKNELTATFNTHMQELERETRMEEAKKSAATSTPVTPPPNPYAYAADEFGRSSYGEDYSYPAEPAVESHVPEAHVQTSEPAVKAEPVVQAVNGSVPRTNGVQPVSVPTPTTEPKDEHPA